MQALPLSTPKIGNKVPKGAGTQGGGVWLVAFSSPERAEFPSGDARADFGLLWPSRGASLSQSLKGGEDREGAWGEEAKEERDKKEKATGDEKPQASKQSIE